MSDSDEEYGPLPTTWGSQAPSTPTDAESESGDKAKGWESLLDPDFEVGPKGLGSGNLHRRGRNFIPVDEHVILAQRLNKPMPKKSNAKKADVSDRDSSSRKSSTHKSTKPSHSKKKPPIKTSPSANNAPQFSRKVDQTNSSSATSTKMGRTQTAFSSRSIPTLSAATKTTKSNAPPELSTIRAPPPNATSWGNATLVETPFWATETDGSHGTEKNERRKRDTVPPKLTTTAINSNGARASNDTSSFGGPKQKTENNCGDSFQSVRVEQKGRLLDEQKEQTKNTDTDDDVNDWTLSDRPTAKGFEVQPKVKKDPKVDEDGWGIWNRPKTNGANSSTTDIGWKTSGWDNASSATPVGPVPAAASSFSNDNASTTATKSNNNIPSNAVSYMKTIPDKKNSPTSSFTNHKPNSPYSEDDWTNNNSQNTWDISNGWTDNSSTQSSSTASTATSPTTNANEKPRFSDPTRQKYSDLHRGPRNKPMNYQRNGRIPIIPTVTAPPPPPENAHLVTINVELSDTMKFPVEIHELDDPTELATQFSQKHNIQQPKIIDALTKLFITQKEMAVKKRNRVLKRTIPTQKQLHENNPFFYQPHAENSAYQRMATASSSSSPSHKYSSSAYASTFYDPKGTMSMPATTPPLSNPYSFARPSTFNRKQYY